MTDCHPKNGYVILIVLIAVAIVLILYATQMKALFLPDVPQDHSSVEQRPWLLEELLVPPDQTIRRPRPPKPELLESFTLETAVSRDGADRGSMTLAFRTNGRLQAGWKVRYTQNDARHAITARMEGNINIDRTYESLGMKDKSRLFFIATGPYQKQAAAAGLPDEEGTAWLIGWLEPDRTAAGHIALTTDRKWSAVYAFATPQSPEESNNSLSAK